jgi:hypothetical protein
MTSWLRAFVGLAAVKTAIGLAGLLVLLPLPGGREWTIGVLRVAGIILYSGSALLLIYGGRRDRRATHLGGAFLLVASSLASAPFPELATMAPRGVSAVLALLNHLNPDAFLPLLLWLFFRDFPRRSVLGYVRAVPRAAIAVSTVAGVVLFLATTAPYFVSHEEAAWELLLLLSRFFWATVALLGLPALAYGVWRARTAPASEQRRMRVFLLGLTLGAGPPLVVFLLAAFFPGLSRELRDPEGPGALAAMLRGVALLIPIATTYAVTVQHVLDVRLVVRKAIRYALARYTVIVLTAFPLALAAVRVWIRRDLPLAELLTGGDVIALLGLSAVGVVLLRARGGVLERIDRRFFREHYDARRTLISLVERCRSIDSLSELARELRERVDQALHLECVDALFLDPRAGCFLSPNGRARRLPVSSLLVRILSGSSDSLDIDLESPHSPLSRLPMEERQYLADGAFRLLTPMINYSGRLVGFLGLGGKLSELGFSGEDRSLLGGVAASAAMTLERLLGVMPEASVAGLQAEASDEDLAGQCGECRSVHPWSSSRCARCGSELNPLALPYVLHGKYRFESRLGAGGMGVVYLARDLTLERWVAIKTLPRLSPERSVWLRREARTMAAISHPHLAQIHGCETWRGVPLLIIEFLGGGTLASRLKVSALPSGEVIALGLALGGVLERAHARGILHRDIKPSNIGYTTQGTPKLLDFGLAKILTKVGGDEDTTVGFSEPATPPSSMPLDLESAAFSGFAGTPAYAAPEALLGRPACPAFDLWGLALVLFEAVTGSNPLRAATRAETVARVQGTRLNAVRNLAPECPRHLANLLDRALEINPRRRPPTARAFCLALERASADLAA